MVFKKTWENPTQNPTSCPANLISTFLWTKGYSLPNFIAFGRTVSKCITNKQTNRQADRQTDILLYIYRYRYTLEVKVLDQKVLLDPRTAQRGKSGKRVVEQSEKSLNFLKNRRNFRMVFQKTWKILPKTPPPAPPTSLTASTTSTQPQSSSTTPPTPPTASRALLISLVTSL